MEEERDAKFRKILPIQARVSQQRVSAAEQLVLVEEPLGQLEQLLVRAVVADKLGEHARIKAPVLTSLIDRPLRQPLEPGRLQPVHLCERRVDHGSKLVWVAAQQNLAFSPKERGHCCQRLGLGGLPGLVDDDQVEMAARQEELARSGQRGDHNPLAAQLLQRRVDERLLR
eukprot:5293435-Pleurochrysis_carterae.AAC.2